MLGDDGCRNTSVGWHLDQRAVEFVSCSVLASEFTEVKFCCVTLRTTDSLAASRPSLAANEQ